MTDYALLNSQADALLRDEPDAHEFPGHIVCDAASRSEIVVPLIVNGSLVGVLDIDSPSIDRFSASDQTGIELLCESFCALQSGRDKFI